MHDKYIPTRHNVLCSLQSTWDVISYNEDFIGVTESTDDTAPPTTFEVLRPELGYFVMVLDRSGSMAIQEEPITDRIDRLKQSVARWLKLDVQDGSTVGITSFS